MTELDSILPAIKNGELIDFARIFRVAAKMEDTGKARHLLNVVAAAAGESKQSKSLAHLTDKNWQEHYAKRKVAIDHLHNEIKSEIGFQKAEVLRRIRRQIGNRPIASAEGDDLLFDPDRLHSDLSDVLHTALLKIIVNAGQDVFDETNLARSFEPPPAEAKAFIADRANLMKNVAQEVFDSIKGEIQNGLDAGESYPALSKRLSNKFDEISEGRGQTVASTEIASAYGFARNKAMQDSGAKFKKWVGSGRPPGTLHGMRPAHAAAHYEGQVRPIDKPFNVGSEALMYPTDPEGSPGNVINCHCVALPTEEPK